MHGMALCGIARHSFMPDSGNTFLGVLQGMPAAFKRVVKHPRACQQHLYERASRSHAKPGFKTRAPYNASISLEDSHSQELFGELPHIY